MLSPIHSHNHNLQELSLKLETHLLHLIWQELLSTKPQTLSLFIILSVACAFVSCMLLTSITMRMSKSFGRLTSCPRTAGNPHDQRLGRRSSLDNLVIPHRTRLPSTQISQVEPLDLAVAKNLLDAAAQGPDMAGSVASNPSEPRGSYDSSFTESDERSRSSGQFYIRQHSRTASWAPGEQCTDGYEDQGTSSGSSSMGCKYHDLSKSHDGPNDFEDGEIFWDRWTVMLPTEVGNINILRADPALAAKRFNAMASASRLAPFGVTQDYGQCPSPSPYDLV